MAFAGAGEGAVQLEEAGLGSAADQAAREQPETAGSCCMGRRRPDHHGADDIEETYHASLPSNIKEDYRLGAAGGAAGSCELKIKLNSKGGRQVATDWLLPAFEIN